MNARKIVEDDMRTFINSALRKGVLTNPRTAADFYKNKKRITSKYTYFQNEKDYYENYYKKYEEGEYLAVFPDGAFIQVNYEFFIKSKNISHLEKMNLCYLPKVVNNEILNEYIRVDYNSDESSFYHSYAHMHIGFRNTIRIPMNEVMLFSEFCKMIMYLYYHDLFEVMFGDTYKTTNTKNKLNEGKLTKDGVLSLELDQFYYLKVT